MREKFEPKDITKTKFVCSHTLNKTSLFNASERFNF